jgi:hypothetical protein
MAALLTYYSFEAVASAGDSAALIITPSYSSSFAALSATSESFYCFESFTFRVCVCVCVGVGLPQPSPAVVPPGIIAMYVSMRKLHNEVSNVEGIPL